MLKGRLILLKLTVAALLVLLASTANAEWKNRLISQGNNIGQNISLTTGGPLDSRYYELSPTQFPRGSGNMYLVGRWGWGGQVARDCNGDGIAEDTTYNGSRAGMFGNQRNSLEAYDLLSARAAAGDRMSSAASEIAVNRVWTSIDADDLADWPAEFREGRTTSGAPIVYGAETVVCMLGDAFGGNTSIGLSIEHQFYFLNFAESNNFIYYRVFFRNMSEYLKWNPNAAVTNKVANTPNGQVWQGFTMTYSQANGFLIGANDEGWAAYFPKGILAICDRDGIEGSFSGHPANMATMPFGNPVWKGQELKLTNTTRHQWTTEFGFAGVHETLEGGRNAAQSYRYGLGKNAPDAPYYPNEVNPWTGGRLYGWPGILEPGDARYNQWIWGSRAGGNHYNFYSEFKDFAPRDSFSTEGVIMYVYPANPPFTMPQSVLSEIDNPAVQTQLAPILANAEVAEIVYGGNYVLPETPTPPALTIIPGDKEVTITWSDINVHTPDAYYYFLQANPALDPNRRYREYDFEGYRLYRSFVGPSDSHSEMIYTCSIGAGNLAFYYKDTQAKDQPLYRMNNGMRVWYALVPYDRNYDPSTGAMFSLPLPTSGKVWNRPGPEGTFNIQPRSEASNFRAADLESMSFVPVTGTQVYDGEIAVLSGDGSGKLTEAPKYLAPPIRSVRLIPINNERITSDKTVSVVCSSIDWWLGGCNRPTGISMLNVVEGGSSGGALALNGGGAAEQTLSLMGPVDAAGVNYAVEMVFHSINANRSHVNLYAVVDPGSYTGGTVHAAQGGCEGRSVGGTPGAAAYTRTGQFRVEWKDAGGGQLTVEIRNVTHNINVPFSEFFDGMNGAGWGFWTEADYGGKIAAGDWNNGPYSNDFRNRVPFANRTVKQKQTLPANNTQEYALWINGIPWVVDNVTSMPAPGTVWTITNAYGTWNSDRTQFTQHGDMPWLGDKFDVRIKGMTLNAEDADLSKVRVVPNPYMASSFLDLSPDSRRVEFVNLPDRCTIRIYSLGGHLVNVLNHIGGNRHGWGNYQDWDRLDSFGNPRQFSGYDNHGGTEPWNLRNRFGVTVASGLYFFHVTDARGKTHTGKFYVIN